MRTLLIFFILLVIVAILVVSYYRVTKQNYTTIVTPSPYSYLHPTVKYLDDSGNVIASTR